MVDTKDLKSFAARRAGSNPALGTSLKVNTLVYRLFHLNIK